MRYAALFFLLFSLPSGFSLAQIVQYGEQALTIDLEPLFPAPETDFTASVNDYSLPSQASTIRWFVDGKLVPEAMNQRTINLKTKKIGSPTVLELALDLPDGGTISARQVVEPIYLDVIIEPQTRTPAFFKGRALPSVGSTVNATAIVNGHTIAPSKLMYTWRLNGKVLGGGALRGQNVMSFTMPQGPYATLNAEVRLVDGGTIGRRIFDIQNAKPTVSFYEKSILYGLRQKALPDSSPLIGSSLTVRAEPYYLDLATYNRPDHLEWKINGVLNQNDNTNPYEVTLAADGGSGQARVSFHVRNTVQLLQGAQSSFGVTY